MKDRTKQWILIGSFALVLAALAVFLPMFLTETRPKSLASEPVTVITPEPKTEEDDVLIHTPAPTPVPVIATPQPVYPEKAVNLLANGKPLFAVASREVAEYLVRSFLNECAAENLSGNAVLLTASIDAELSTLPADGTVEYLEYDAALNLLRRDRSLIPVRRTAERVEIRTEALEPQSARTPLLPEGSRMFKKLGAPSRTLVYIETLYQNGLPVSETETLNTPLGTGIARSELVGIYRKPAVTAGDPNVPAPQEGQLGPMPASLSFVHPVRGTVIGLYGLITGEMRYGIDYTAAPETRIVAPESGTVIFMGERAGLGFVIDIRHDESFVSRIAFGANTAVPGLMLEKHVTRGETIAHLPVIEGEKESVLHYELLIDGIPYNPLFYLPANQ
ncbi:MAG: M23 family metallopeptidase [Clostridia bacterium]|nr:M23 family metallopeptidase [Clostridia bacterium]